MVCSENQTIESKSVMISRLQPGTLNRKDGKMKVTPVMLMIVYELPFSVLDSGGVDGREQRARFRRAFSTLNFRLSPEVGNARVGGGKSG